MAETKSLRGESEFVTTKDLLISKACPCPPFLVCGTLSELSRKSWQSWQLLAIHQKSRWATPGARVHSSEYWPHTSFGFASSSSPPSISIWQTNQTFFRLPDPLAQQLGSIRIWVLRCFFCPKSIFLAKRSNVAYSIPYIFWKLFFCTNVFQHICQLNII